MSPLPSARLAELRGLIVSLFSTEEFRRWLAQHASDSEILAELPGDAAAPAELVDKALLALERRGGLGPLFFARLQEARGGRSEEIKRIAALWSRSEWSGPSAELAGSGASKAHAHGASVTMWAGRWGQLHVRLWCWCVGHPTITGSAAAALLFVSLATLGVLAVIDEQRSAKQAQVRQVNAHHAEMIAGTVLLEIEAFRNAVARVAADRSLVAAIEGDDYERVQAICEASYLQHEQAANGEEPARDSPFDLWFVLDAKGVLRAQFGRAGRAGTLNREYRWRDYFVGAEKLGPEPQATYVSRAFRSEGDGYHKFAISAPLRGEDGRLVGVLVAGIASDASLGSVAMDNDQSVAVLVAPRDRERRRDPRRQFPYLIIRHPAFDYGESIGMASEQVRRLDERRRDGVARFWPRPVGRVDPISGYNDPVGAIDEEYTGSWSAGFAAVGQTGLVIIVQSRDEEVMKTERNLAWQIALSTVGAAPPGLMIVGLIACRRLRRRAADQRGPRRDRKHAGSSYGVVAALRADDHSLPPCGTPTHTRRSSSLRRPRYPTTHRKPGPLARANSTECDSLSENASKSAHCCTDAATGWDGSSSPALRCCDGARLTWIYWPMNGSCPDRRYSPPFWRAPVLHACAAGDSPSRRPPVEDHQPAAVEPESREVAGEPGEPLLAGIRLTVAPHLELDRQGIDPVPNEQVHATAYSR